MGDADQRHAAVELPVLSGSPECPAAFPIAGAARSQQGVVCRIMEDDAQEDAGLDMTAGQLGVVRNALGGVYLNLKSDPSSVVNFCYGPALGRSTDGDEGPRAHFTFCPVWEAWDERRRARKDGLYEELEPEPVSMGVADEPAVMMSATSSDADNPWAQARRDLDELAPAKERAA